MSISLNEDRLRAYVDGELDRVEAAQVEEQLRHDANAAAFVQRERDLRERLQAAFAPVLDEPTPQRLLDAIERGAHRPAVVDLAAERARRRPVLATWPAWMGMAAALLLGLLLGPRLMPGQAPIGSEGGPLVAQADLARALDTQPAGAHGAVRLATSFVDARGDYCRSFVLEREASAGLACRRGSAWQVEVLARTEGGAAGEFRQAASTLPPAVLQAIDARIAGAPLDAAAEAAAVQRGWRRP